VTEAPTIDPALMLALQEATKTLPNAKPRSAARKFQGICDAPLDMAIVVTPDGGVEIDFENAEPADVGGGMSLTPEDVQGCIVDDPFDRKRLSPKGAALMIRLYEAGLFDLQRKRDGLADPTALRAYAASEPELRARTLQMRAATERERAQRDHLIEHPHHVREEQFDYRLLDQIFWKHCGPGSHTLWIGGLSVQKSVVSYTSNSGKSRDSEVVFSWVGSDGQAKEIRKPSAFAGNRRNDPDRNWGLPE
jgi:hypothetical protein